MFLLGFKSIWYIFDIDNRILRYLAFLALTVPLMVPRPFSSANARRVELAVTKNTAKNKMIIVFIYNHLFLFKSSTDKQVCRSTNPSTSSGRSIVHGERVEPSRRSPCHPLKLNFLNMNIDVKISFSKNIISYITLPKRTMRNSRIT